MNELLSYSPEELSFLLRELEKLHQLTSSENDQEGTSFLSLKIQETRHEISRRDNARTFN